MAIPEAQRFRNSKKRMPTRVALADDENELAAKQSAVTNLAAERASQDRPRRTPLSQFDMGGIKPIAMTADAPDLPESPTDIVTDEGGGVLGPDGATSYSSWEETDRVKGSLEDPLRRQVGDWLEEQMNEEESERRVARQRSAQEAMVRATMGAGEAGRSGAAALLQGEAGRLAESQARVAEMEREFELTGLSTWLMGFDLNAERYSEAEKQMAQQAAMNSLENYDLNYVDMMNFLGIPQHAWTKAGEETYNKVRDVMNGPDNVGDEDGDGDIDEQDEIIKGHKKRIGDDAREDKRLRKEQQALWQTYKDIDGFENLMSEHDLNIREIVDHLQELEYTPSSGDWYWEGAWNRPAGIFITGDLPVDGNTHHVGTIEYDDKTFNQYTYETTLYLRNGRRETVVMTFYKEA